MLIIINTIKKQYPQLWDEYLVELVTDNIQVAYKSELELIDWIFEEGTPDHISKAEIINFLNYNFNVVCNDLNLDLKFDVDDEMFEDKSLWFKVKVFMTSEPDFFNAPVSGYASDDEKVNEDEIDI